MAERSQVGGKLVGMEIRDVNFKSQKSLTCEKKLSRLLEIRLDMGNSGKDCGGGRVV